MYFYAEYFYFTESARKTKMILEDSLIMINLLENCGLVKKVKEILEEKPLKVKSVASL